MSSVRDQMTPRGRKEIVDVTLVDGSKKSGGVEQVMALVAIFFDVSQEGAASLKHSKTVVCLYGLTCVPHGNGVCKFKTGQSFFWE